MRRNAHRRNESEPQAAPEPSTTATAPVAPSAGPVEPIEQQETTEAEDTTKEPTRAERMQGRLVELQEKLRGLIDYDQVAEIRLALSSRSADLEKHVKKAGELGVREEDARRRIRLIQGSDTRFGLLRIFAPEETTEQTDVFFDPSNPNGRPDATITFKTIDGEEIVCTLDQLEQAEKLIELRALYQAGILPGEVETAIKDGDFWHLIEADDLALAVETGAVSA